MLKNECDGYRAQKCSHPLAIKHHLEAIPYQTTPAELIETWRNNRQGIAFLHMPTNFRVYGAIDDIWVTPKGELIIVDYKATAKNGDLVMDQDYHDTYRRQLDLYSWLFKMNGYPIYGRAFWIYCNGIKNLGKFDNCLYFDTKLIEHTLNIEWIERTLQEVFNCLRQPIPPKRTEKMGAKECKFCDYLTKLKK